MKFALPIIRIGNAIGSGLLVKSEPWLEDLVHGAIKEKPSYILRSSFEDKIGFSPTLVRVSKATLPYLQLLLFYENPNHSSTSLLETGRFLNQPSHTAVSQQTAVLNKDINSLLVASSQKDMTIEQSSQPRAQAKRFDVAPINVESQPKSLVIEAPQTPNSPTNSLDVDMINTSIPDSPSLNLLGKPKSSTSEHHLLDDLFSHLPILSGTVETSVPKFSSICTESTIVSTPNTFISNHSMDSAHPSSSVCIPTDKLNSSYPSDSQTANPTDIPYMSSVSVQLQISSIISSAEDLVVVQSLLGLREGSELSEGLGCSKEKGEEKSENNPFLQDWQKRV
ncbi:hypothetical protein AgCh_006013 [Apium graveolens]